MSNTGTQWLWDHAYAWAIDRTWDEVAREYADWFVSYWADSVEYASHTNPKSLDKLMDLHEAARKALDTE